MTPRSGKTTSKAPVLWAAFVVLVAFSVLLVYMFHHVSTDDKSWSRYSYLYGSVQAIAFAAAGALFGTQVQRQQTKHAVDLAKDAQRRGDDNADAAAKGKALAGAVRAEREAHKDLPGVAGADLSAPQTPQQSAAATASRLAAIADELFPRARNGTSQDG
jgi:hypothetical protein